MSGGNTTINQLTAATVAQLIGTTTVPVQLADSATATGLTLHASLTNLATAMSTLLVLGTMAFQNANAVAITGGTINGTTIGATTAASGAFTSLSSSTGLTVTSGGAAITGNTSVASGTFTANGGAVALSPASANVVISPTGTGVVTISPATAGTINNVSIGGVTPLSGAFTALSSSTGLTVSSGGAAITGNSTVTGTLDVTSNATFGGSTSHNARVNIKSTSTNQHITLEQENATTDGWGFRAYGGGGGHLEISRMTGTTTFTAALTLQAVASQNRGFTFIPSNGGNPAFSVTGGSLSITSHTLFGDGIGVSGDIPAYAANTIFLDNTGSSASRIQFTGTNNSTNGSLAFISTRSDGSNSITALSISNTGAATFVSTVTVAGTATLLTTTNALTDGAGAQVGTLTNAPTAGNPAKWIAINDAGTTRYIPTWT